MQLRYLSLEGLTFEDKLIRRIKKQAREVSYLLAQVRPFRQADNQIPLSYSFVASLLECPGDQEHHQNCWDNLTF